MDLRDAHLRLVDEIREQMFLLTAAYPMTESGATLEYLSEQFEALGICHLLTRLDVGQFRENLLRSGHARRYYLRKSREQNNLGDHRLALSRCDGFLAAMAAGDISLAFDIADLSLEEWHPAWEYEDDYCFFLFLHDSVRRSRGVETRSPMEVVDRFEKALEGQPALRLEVCRALSSGDAGNFADGLAALMEAKQEESDGRRMVVPDTDVAFWPRSALSVEGLALLKAAELNKLRVDREFPLCPPEGRLRTEESSSVDFFTSLEEALAADR
jgi:Immunity protein 49